MIRPLKINEAMELLGSDFVANFQRDMSAIISPLRRHLELKRPLSMGKELWEYVVADSIPGAVWNGAGHSLADVILTDNVVADIKSLSYNPKSTATTEASMYQCFDQNAKTFFKDKDKQSLWNLYVNGWFDKAYGFDKYYIFAIMRQKESIDCKLICFEVTSERPVFNDELCTFTNKSMKIAGMADSEFVKIRYYNSKSRLEIMFTKRCWTDEEYALPIFKY